MQFRITALIGISFIMMSASAQSQPSERRMTRAEYIDTYKDDAVREMHKSGVPASITLAQGILESGNGNSPLAKYAKNHFGIKCHKGWEGPTFIQDDDEKNECFRKYYSVFESYKDHSNFLRTRSRYDFLFDLKTTNYKGWAKGLSKAGYATNPKYPQLLIRIIDDNELYQYDISVQMPVLASKSAPKEKKEQRLEKRDIKLHENDIKYVIARSGDSYFKIAKEHDMGLWQIKKYNDLNPCDEIIAGDIIYLQPKRNKARVEQHTVRAGETMRSISQRYGIKLNKLYAKNNMIMGTEPIAGQVLDLRKRKEPVNPHSVAEKLLSKE